MARAILAFSTDLPAAPQDGVWHVSAALSKFGSAHVLKLDQNRRATLALNDTDGAVLAALRAGEPVSSIRRRLGTVEVEVALVRLEAAGAIWSTNRIPTPPIDAAQGAVPLLGLPFDWSDVANGTAGGPRWIREALAGIVGHDPYASWFTGYGGHRFNLSSIADWGDLASAPAPDRRLLQTMLPRLLAGIRSGPSPIFLCGDHSASFHVVEALSHDTVDVLVFDAHDDANDGLDLDHGTWVSHLLGLPHVGRVVIVGTRGLSRIDRAMDGCARRLSTVPAYACDREGFDHVVASLNRRSVYMSIDLDVLDPTVFPAVTCPRPGGLSYDHLLRTVLKAVEHLAIVGVDICEFATQRADTARSALTAASLLAEIIAAMAVQSSAEPAGKEACRAR